MAHLGNPQFQTRSQDGPPGETNMKLYNVGGHHTGRSSVSKVRLFALCSCASVGYADPPEAGAGLQRADRVNFDPGVQLKFRGRQLSSDGALFGHARARLRARAVRSGVSGAARYPSRQEHGPSA